MEKRFLEEALRDFVNASPGNYLAQEAAIKPGLAGLRFFAEPLFGYASAEDPLFGEFKKPGVIGAHYLEPREWLPSAETVICAFLPFTGAVKTANAVDMDWPAAEWLHARIEGQNFQNEICGFLVRLLADRGFEALSPMIDTRLKLGDPLFPDHAEQGYYNSNWSERHAAYAAGLGSFGLSRGLISAAGVAGRYISVLTSLKLEPLKRQYTGVYDYCNRCGACVRNCPAGAISLERGKSHPLCFAFVERTRKEYAPRYGCGKCQVRVPCQNRIPRKPAAGSSTPEG
jgi:epoxyqueuosine reductase QueG